jgi:hypothetical protein
MDCSDKNRRSLSQALRTAELGEEALAFVAGKTTRPSAEIPATTTSKQATSSRDGDSLASTQPLDRVPNPKPPDAQPVVEGIVSITVRLPASLPLRLLRASVERKLQRKHPFTQQDIVTAALQQWLTQHAEKE